MQPSPINAHGVPQESLKNGIYCPGCGVPFHTERTPGAGPEGAVSTGISINFEGLLVLCDSCVEMLAQQIGWINPEAGKARASDVRLSQRRDKAVKAVKDDRASVRAAAAALVESLDALDEVLA